jgi:O-antigen ligase
VRKPHNDYLEAYARLGLLGLVLFIGILGTALVSIVRGARAALGVEASFMWFVVAQSLVLLVIAATQPLLAFSYGTVPLFFTLGAALAVAAGRTGDRQVQAPASHASNPFG